VEALGYKVAEEFPIPFDDEGKDIAMCSVLEPGNRVVTDALPWKVMVPFQGQRQEYVLAGEIFVSEGTKGSIVYDWAERRGGGGLHHIALQIDDGMTVQGEMEKWLANGWAEEFSSKEPIVCEELVQVFTKPSKLTGVVFELIDRKKHGFCRSSVKDLMLSTKGD
jgi:hypothetical protein